MKTLILDDERTIEQAIKQMDSLGYFVPQNIINPGEGDEIVLCRTMEEAFENIASLKRRYDYWLLDHDLGMVNGETVTAMQFLKSVVEGYPHDYRILCGYWPSYPVVCHSANPVGRENMIAYIQSASNAGMLKSSR